MSDMTTFKALSILCGQTPVQGEEQAVAVLEWAESHPEVFNTGSLQRAADQLRAMVEGGVL